MDNKIRVEVDLDFSAIDEMDINEILVSAVRDEIKRSVRDIARDLSKEIREMVHKEASLKYDKIIKDAVASGARGPKGISAAIFRELAKDMAD